MGSPASDWIAAMSIDNCARNLWRQAKASAKRWRAMGRPFKLDVMDMRDAFIAHSVANEIDRRARDV